MSTVLEVEKVIWDRIPGLILIWGELEIGTAQEDQIASYLQSSWNKLSGAISQDGYKNHPLIAKWREALIGTRIPVKKFPPSIESIAKRVKQQDVAFQINPIVDTYNAMSMDLTLPLGAFDTEQLVGNLQLRISEGKETFMALGAKEFDNTVSGEIVYADDHDILTRQFIWRQSDKGKITNKTKRIIFVCELLMNMGEDVLSRADELIRDKFTSLLAGTIQSYTILKS